VARQRTLRAITPRTCDLCADERLVLVESRWERRGLARLDPRWRPDAVTYDLCRRCGAKYRVERA
jgi:hypothetical protein